MALSLQDVMEAGEPLDLDVLQKDNSIIRLKSNVIQLINELDFTAAAPIYKGNVYAMDVGATVQVNIARDTTGLFSFYATVTSRGVDGRVAYVQMRKNSDIKKSQRRRFFRLPFVGEIKIKDPDAPELTEAEKAKLEKLKEKYKDNPNIIIEENEESYIELTGKDLSGGGFKALSDKPFKEGSKQEGVLILGEHEIPFTGQVVRCMKTVGSFEQFEIGFAFSEMDENDRSRIISYIFQKQRSMRRKGLI